MQPENKRPDPNPESDRLTGFLKTASLWALIVLIPLALFQLMKSSREERGELTYTRFRAQVAAENVTRLTIRDGQEVEGELESPVAVRGTEFQKFTTRLPAEPSQEFLDELVAQGVEIEATESGSNWVSVLVTALPWVLIIGLWIFFIRQMQGGGSRAFSFGKSKAKLLSGDTPEVTFEDVAGCDEAKEELEEIIEFLKDPGKFSRLGGRLPKGALLVGPPGTGKTLLARAVAGEAGRPFFSMSGSDFVEMFVGVGASVTGDTPVLIRDDSGTRLVAIGEYVDGIYEAAGEDAGAGSARSGPVLPVSGTQTLGYRSGTTGFRGSLDVFGGSAWSDVRGVYRHQVDQIYEVEYLGGTIRTTGDHSVFVRGHGGIRARAVRDLAPGDVLVNLPFHVRGRYDSAGGTAREARAHAFPSSPARPDLRVALDESQPAVTAAFAHTLNAGDIHSRRDLAEMVEVSPSTVGNWQTGRHLLDENRGTESVGHAKPPVVRSVTRKPHDGYVYDLCGCENEAFFGGEKPVLLHNSRVRDLFEQGKSHAPCIIFIDEIDAVGRHRGAGLGGGHDEREQTLNQLLVEMDGFEANNGVILLAATNRPDVLDPALLRPGRFDRQIVVDSPDVKGREGILRVHTKEIPLAEDVDLSVLAKGTPGLSGADLENIVNEAALLAAREDKDRVYMEDMEAAKDKVMLGAERKSMVISEEERRVTAYHEAGHAVIALRVPGLDPLHKVTIVPRGRALGITASLPEEDRHNYTRHWLEGQLVMLFGGRVAEEMVFGPSKITTGAGNDIERATGMARRMVTQFGMSDAIGPMTVGDREQEVFLGKEISQRREVSQKTAELVDSEVKRILDDAYRRCREVLEENRSLLERVAEALLERETLDADDIQRLDDGRALEPLPDESGPEAAAAGAEEARPTDSRPERRPRGELGGGEPSPAPA